MKNAEMISVEQARAIIVEQNRDWGTIYVPLAQASGRVLWEQIRADRDFPPFHRVTMDGIAIDYSEFEQGKRDFRIHSTQAAGHAPHRLEGPGCIEVMTGAVLPLGTDTVIRYEDLTIQDGKARLNPQMGVKKGQNVHLQGSDKKAGDVLVPDGFRIGPAEIGIAASVGKTELLVATHPKIAIVSTGDELVPVEQIPLPYQIRRSNSHSITALLLEKTGIDAEIFHFNDNPDDLLQGFESLLKNFDLVVCSGAVSEGKYDFLPTILEQLGVECLFHKVAQRPGKPFWFGKSEKCLVFGLPGNPVSTFVCALYYVLPFVEQRLGLPPATPKWAQLQEPVSFNPSLTYFLSVRLQQNEEGRICATPVPGKGSGDLSSLHLADGFLLLPPERSTFMVGEIFPLIQFRP